MAKPEVKRLSQMVLVSFILFLSFNYKEDCFIHFMRLSALLNAVVSWGGSSKDRDRKRLNKLVRRASSVLDCLLDSTDVVGERRMFAKLTSIMDNTSHPLHWTAEALSSSFSSRLLHPLLPQFLQIY